jgi:hypothetical protein
VAGDPEIKEPVFIALAEENIGDFIRAVHIAQVGVVMTSAGPSLRRAPAPVLRSSALAKSYPPLLAKTDPGSVTRRNIRDGLDRRR